MTINSKINALFSITGVLLFIVLLASIAHSTEGDIVWSLTSSSSSTAEIGTPQYITSDSNYIYIAGMTTGNNAAVEKRRRSDGLIMWAIIIPSNLSIIQNSNQTIAGITVNDSGVYVNEVDRGNKYSTNGIVISGGADSLASWQIIKLDKTNGNRLWVYSYGPKMGSTYIDGTYGKGIVVDSSNNIYTVGYNKLVRSSNGYVCPVLIAKIARHETSSGSKIWELNYSPSMNLPCVPSQSAYGNDYATAVAVDSSGIYTGITLAQGLNYIQIQKLSASNGSLIWSQNIPYNTTSTPNLVYGNDIQKIIVQGNYIYLAIMENKDPTTALTNNQWRIQKRSASDGTLIWDKTIDHTAIDNRTTDPSFDKPLGLALYNGGLFVTGSGGENKYLITKLNDTNGELLWTISETSPASKIVGFASVGSGDQLYLIGSDNGHNRIENRTLSMGSTDLCPILTLSAGTVENSLYSSYSPSNSGYISKNTSANLWYVDVTIKNNTPYTFSGATDAALIFRKPLGIDQFISSPSGYDVNKGWVYYDAWLCDGNTQNDKSYAYQNLIDSNNNPFFTIPHPNISTVCLLEPASTPWLLSNNIMVPTNWNKMYLPKTTFAGYITENNIQYPIMRTNIPTLAPNDQIVVENVQWLRYDLDTPPQPATDFNFQLDCTNTYQKNLPPVVSTTTRNIDYNSEKKSEYLNSFIYDELPNDLTYSVDFETPALLDCNINGKFIDYVPRNILGNYYCTIRATDKYGLSSTGAFNVNMINPAEPSCTISAQNNPINPNSDANFTITASDFPSSVTLAQITSDCNGAAIRNPSITQVGTNTFQAICQNYIKSNYFKTHITQGTKTADCNIFLGVVLSADAGPDAVLNAGGSAQLFGSAMGSDGNYDYNWSIKSTLNNNCAILDSNLPTARITCEKTTTYFNDENAIIQLTVKSNGSTVIDTTTATIHPTLYVTTGAELSASPNTLTALSSNPIGGVPPYNFYWSFPYQTDGSCQIPQSQNQNIYFTCGPPSPAGVKTARVRVIDSGPIVQTAYADVNVYVTESPCANPAAICMPTCSSTRTIDMTSPSCTISGASAQCCVPLYNDLNLSSITDFGGTYDGNNIIAFTYQCNKSVPNTQLIISDSNNSGWYLNRLVDCGTTTLQTSFEFVNDETFPKNTVLEAVLKIPQTTPCDTCTSTVYLDTSAKRSILSIPDNSPLFLLAVLASVLVIITASTRPQKK